MIENTPEKTAWSILVKMTPKLLLPHPVFSVKVTSGIFTIEAFTLIFRLVVFSVRFYYWKTIHLHNIRKFIFASV